jgi:hypothetical protein
MAKKTLVRDQDKFMLRLPDGMRDRIKAKADRAGMSMNEAIVWLLDRHFPAPQTLDDKLDELATMAAMLKSGGDPEQGVDRLIAEIHDAVTQISAGKIPAPADFQDRVHKRLEKWETEQYDNAQDDDYDRFSDEVVKPAKTDWDDETDPEEPFGQPI